MKVQLESTLNIVDLVINGVSVPVRIWEGTTEYGVRCHAYITHIEFHDDDDATQFEAELKECAAPSVDILAIPLRLIL